MLLARAGRVAWMAALAVLGCEQRPTAATVDAGPDNKPSPTAETETSDAGGMDLIEDGNRYAVKEWSFALDHYELRVEDTGMSTALDSVLARTKSELVVNGGFFDTKGAPLGLAMSGGTITSPLDEHLSGGVIASDGESATLSASEGFTMPKGARFAIQCRPRLVVDGSANVKSDDKKRAERSALCIRNWGHTVDVVVVRASDDGQSPGPSLFALAHYLAAHRCEGALNLDGGPSTGAAWRDGDTIELLAPRAPIRHVVAFHKR